MAATARAQRTRRAERPVPRPRVEARSSAGQSLAVWITGVLATLCCIGLIMVASASSVVSIAYYGSTWAIAIRECLWMAIGVVAFAGAARMQSRTLERLATIAVLGSVALLIVVLVPGVGSSAFGASRWIGVGLLRIQPSELAKFAMCLYAAHIIATRERVETEWGRVLVPIAVMTAMCAGLVLLQPDMGTAVVVVAIAVSIVVAAGAPMRAVWFSLALMALAGMAATAASSYRRRRLLSFLHPQLDPQGTGYQLTQSKIGFGTGRLLGLGLGNSREKWGLLPNPHTDFIFSIIGEELGLLGALLVLGLLVTLVILGLRVARLAPDRFSQLTAVGVSMWLATETVVNVGASTGVLPVTGIPLPFISFGGTSLVIDMAAVGILAGIARRSAPKPSLRVVAPHPRAVRRGPGASRRPVAHTARSAPRGPRHR